MGDDLHHDVLTYHVKSGTKETKPLSYEREFMITIATAREFVTERGYRIFAYDGRVRNAPPSIRHVLRERGAGYYAYKDANSSVYLLSEENNINEDQLYLTAYYCILIEYLLSVYDVAFEDDGGRWYYREISSGTGRVGPYDTEDAAIEAAVVAYDLMPANIIIDLNLIVALEEIEIEIQYLLNRVQYLRGYLSGKK